MSNGPKSRDGSLADRFLRESREKGTPVSIYLISGFQLKGEVVEYDDAAVLFKHRGTHQMVMRQAIANMYPAGSASDDGWWRFYAAEEEDEPAEDGPT